MFVLETMCASLLHNVIIQIMQRDEMWVQTKETISIKTELKLFERLDWRESLNVSEIMQYLSFLSFCVWLMSLSIMYCMSIHAVVNSRIFFFFKVVVCVYHIFFIHSSVNGHLGFFHVWAILNTLARNMRVQVICSRFLLEFWINTHK